MAVQQFCLGKTGPVQAGLGFALGLAQMQLHSQILFLGIDSQCLPKQVIAGVFAVNAGINADSSVVMAVPFVCDTNQLLTLFIGFKVEILGFVDITLGRKSNIGLDARFIHGFCRGSGVII